MHGIGQLINAWEEEITKRQIEQEDGSKLGSDTNIQNSVLAPADDGNNVLDFIASHKLELSWKCPRYYSPGFFDRVRMLLRGIYDRFRYGETDGSIFIPSLIVKRWVEDARKQLKAGEYVSTIDIVTAWIYKVRNQKPPAPFCGETIHQLIGPNSIIISTHSKSTHHAVRLCSQQYSRYAAVYLPFFKQHSPTPLLAT